MSSLSFKNATLLEPSARESRQPPLRIVRHAADRSPAELSKESPSAPIRVFDFDAWYKQYGSLVTRLVHKAVGDYQKAEDLISICWEKIHRNGHRYDSQKGKETTFIMCIAKRTVVDFLRRQRSSDRVNGNNLGDADEALTASSIKRGGGAVVLSSPLERLVAHEHQSELLRLLDCIPEFQRGILKRHYLLGLTLRQISEDDGIPLGTIKSALNRGLQEMRRRTEELV